LNPIEKTIRTALARGDAEDRAYREKVYRSVYTALEKSIAANPAMSDEAVEHRRELLKSSIRTVEQEFVQAFEPEDPFDTEEPVPAPAAPIKSFGPFPRAPTPGEHGSSWTAASNRYYEGEHEGVRPTPRPPHRPAAPAREPAPPPPQRFGYDAVPLPDIEPRRPRGEDDRSGLGFGGLVARREAHNDDRRFDHRALEDRQPRRRRGRLLVMLFLVATLLAAGVMGVWWALDSGLFLSAKQRDTSVPNPPLTLEDEEFQPGGPPPLSDRQAGGGNDEWITVFTPTDPTRVITPPGGVAEVIEIEGGTALRIRSASSDEPIRFEVGEGILQDIAGRRAVFNIRARTDPGKETQILVACDFGPVGDCGRNRFFVSSENRDFAVGRDMANARPNGAGSIAIVSDVANGGLTVDIIDIRVAIPE
jgi:hypothetical protein